MSYLLAFLGFVALIVLHEAGHFAVAKAVGMRVERFSLFFPPLIAKVRRGETEYGIGALPFGGYVKITGMNPNEELTPQLQRRAYYNQAVWKRVAVIAAGPAVNIVIAFAIIWVLLLSNGTQGPLTGHVAGVESKTPAASVLRTGDTVLSADGSSRSADAIRAAIDRHRCAGTPADGCSAATPVALLVRRDGRDVNVSLRPRYVGAAKRMEIGVEFSYAIAHPGALSAAGNSASYMWSVTSATVTRIVKLFEPQDRKQLHGVVGSYSYVQSSFASDTTRAVEVLALISLSLGVINLFPFLPLDGGHIFWALAEKLRGRRISFAVMERAGIVGFALILLLFVVGLTNDIHTLNNGGFKVGR